MTVESEIEAVDQNQNNSSDSPLSLKNPNLSKLSEDILYHLSLGTGTHDVQEMFKDVKFVCVGGTSKRMFDFAELISKELKIKLPTGAAIQDICQPAYRFSMFKVGPVLCVSHGMGGPSISIMLHEVIKLVFYAGCTDVVFLRLGTCGGIGVNPGTVVVTTHALDGLLRPYMEMKILGKVVNRPAVFDSDLVRELSAVGENINYPTVSGKTVCTDDFYEGQARVDGAICDYTEEEKMSYLQQLKENGVVNIEMESLTMGAICHYAGVKAAVICVTLLDRLNGDQVEADHEALNEWQKRPQILASTFIKRRLGII